MNYTTHPGGDIGGGSPLSNATFLEEVMSSESYKLTLSFDESTNQNILVSRRVRTGSVIISDDYGRVFYTETVVTTTKVKVNDAGFVSDPMQYIRTKVSYYRAEADYSKGLKFTFWDEYSSETRYGDEITLDSYLSPAKDYVSSYASVSSKKSNNLKAELFYVGSQLYHGFNKYQSQLSLTSNANHYYVAGGNMYGGTQKMKLGQGVISASKFISAMSAVETVYSYSWVKDGTGITY